MSSDIMRYSRRVFVTVLIVAIVAAVAYTVQILLLVFAGILFAILLRSSGTWISEHTGLSIHLSMILVLIVFGALLLGSIWTFGVQIVDQADRLFWAVSEAFGELQKKLAQYHIASSFSPGDFMESPAKTVASGMIWAAASFVLVLFICLYLAVGPQLYTDLFLSFFNGRQRRRMEHLLNELESALRWWLVGQLIAMSVVGVITTTGLLLIGAPMALSLGVLAALLTFVPYVGALASAVPAILLAFTKGTDMVMYVVVIYLIAHIMEGYIVVPLIQHKLVYLPPAMILAMQFLMELFAGIIGITFATPLMVVGMVLIKNFYFKQGWDEPAEGEPSAEAPAA